MEHIYQNPFQQSILLKEKALDRHLEVPVPEAIYDRLIELLKESNETK